MPIKGAPSSQNKEARTKLYPRFCSPGCQRRWQPGCVVICLARRAGCTAVRSLPGVAWLHPFRCGKIQLSEDEPNPLALLPIARSPSRCHCWRPLVGSYPTLSPLTCRAQILRTAAALLSVAVVVTPPIAVVRPHLLFHGAIVSAVPKRSREVPLLTADQQRRRNLFWIQLLSCRSRCLSGPLPPDFSYYYFLLCLAGCQVVTAQAEKPAELRLSKSYKSVRRGT